VGTDEGLATFVAELPADQAGGVLQLLDVLAAQGFADASQPSREQLLRNVSLASREAAGGVRPGASANTGPEARQPRP